MAKLLTQRPDYQSDAERKVVDALVDQLSDDWAIAHSVAWTSSADGIQKDGECDVVALGPQGLVTIEVKGGAIARNGSNVFTSTDRHGKTHELKRSPVAQAVSAKYKLRERIWAMKIMGGEYAHALAFPDCVASGAHKNGLLDFDLEGGVLIDGDTMSKIGEHVEGLVPGKTAVPFTGTELDRIQEMLEPSWALGGSLGLEASNTADASARLTDMQHQMVKGLWASARAVVKGCAGSGKSVIALRMAAEMAADGRRSLYVCFNRPLADHQTEEAAKAGLGDQLKVTTFHQLIEEWLKLAKIDFGQVQAGSGDYYDRMVELARENLAVGESYDVIVIDEGQDFEQDWVELLEMALVDPETSTFYMFLDPAQNIYRGGVSPEIDGATPFELRTNCRSAATLAKSVADRLGDAPPACLFDGGYPVDEIVCDSAESADEELRNLMHRLTQDEGLDPHDIVVQTMARPAKSRAWGKKLGNLTLVGRAPDSFEVPPLGPNDVRIETVHRFKGLETPATIIIETEHIASENLPNLLRVGLTRATTYAALIRYNEPATE